jgi:benzoyl-CoA reductase/2-hydroxyglutaryl-CoA dehydratase subunit BcrC/BadD/HgdB
MKNLQFPNMREMIFFTNENYMKIPNFQVREMKKRRKQSLIPFLCVYLRPKMIKNGRILPVASKSGFCL